MAARESGPGVEGGVGGGRESRCFVELPCLVARSRSRHKQSTWEYSTCPGPETGEMGTAILYGGVGGKSFGMCAGNTATAVAHYCSCVVEFRLLVFDLFDWPIDLT